MVFVVFLQHKKLYLTKEIWYIVFRCSNMKILLFLLLFLASCAKNDPVSNERVDIDTDQRKKIREAADKGGGYLELLAKILKKRDKEMLVLEHPMFYGEQL